MRFLGSNAEELIREYNNSKAGRRYNRVAKAVYLNRANYGDRFCRDYQNHVIDGLIGFDMARTFDGSALIFGERLEQCLAQRSTNCSFGDCTLSSVDLLEVASSITDLYECLALKGKLHSSNQSHVAATKVLHWLFPETFLMIDSNVAAVFREHFGVPYKRSTQPGYCAGRYLECMQHAQGAIRQFGVEQFRQLEPGTPEARVFDKMAFIAGQRLNQ